MSPSGPCELIRKETTRRHASWCPGRSSPSNRRPSCYFLRTWTWQGLGLWPTSKRWSRTGPMWQEQSITVRLLVLPCLIDHPKMKRWRNSSSRQVVSRSWFINDESHCNSVRQPLATVGIFCSRKLESKVPRSSTSFSGSEMVAWYKTRQAFLNEKWRTCFFFWDGSRDRGSYFQYRGIWVATFAEGVVVPCWVPCLSAMAGCFDWLPGMDGEIC